LILAFFPLLLALGIWALIGVACVGLIAALFFYFGTISSLVLELILLGVSITLIVFFCVALLAGIGFVAHYSNFAVRRLRLGSRPIMGNESSLLVRYKELWLDYASSGFRVLAVALMIALFAMIISISFFPNA